MSGIVRTADGQSQPIIGTVDVPITYNDNHSNFEFLLVSSIRQSSIFGKDFWNEFGIKVPISGMIEKLDFQNHDMFTVCKSKTRKLRQTMELFPSFEKEGLGKTTLIEHSIDTG